MNTIVLRRTRKIGTSLFIFFSLGLLAGCAGRNDVILTPFLPPTPIPTSPP